jgi:hypothetical protein
VADERLGPRLGLTDEHRRRLVAFLLAAQLNEARGFHPGNPHHGGWDLVGEVQLKGTTTGTNVSVSCFALEALAKVAASTAAAGRSRAAAWAKGCQNFPGDGGFRFHPHPDGDGNKAQWDDAGRTRPRSYGTATCDGLRCLLYTGVAIDDPRVVAAAGWLAARPEVDVVPGFEKTPADLGWGQGLRYYYLATLAKTLPYLPQAEARRRREAMVRRLAADQRADGRWENDSAAMREDDPLIATSFALVALGESLEGK